MFEHVLLGHGHSVARARGKPLKQPVPSFCCLVEQTAQMRLWSTNYFASCIYYSGQFALAPHAQITIPDCHIEREDALHQAADPKPLQFPD
jgi:hypothetical protein